MSIHSYQKFLNEQLLTEGLREMKFVLSHRLRDALGNIYHRISDELLSLHNDLDSKKKQTFVDICENQDDRITFIQANKATELLGIDTEEKYVGYDKNVLNHLTLSDPVYNQHRSTIRVGTFINNVFGVGTFPTSAPRGVPSLEKPDDVESFVRLYKATYSKEEKYKLMEVVSGNDISYWYNYGHYNNNDGTLGGSCMSGVRSNFFDIYTKNPNVGLLILYSDETKTKIKGRAVVWKDLISPEGRTYMDRIYTNNSSDEELFIEYAKDQNWLYRNQRGYSSNSDVVDPSGGISSNMTLRSQLSSVDHNYYPYMDTMIYYNPNTGKISNKESGMKYYLADTGGGSDEIDGYDNDPIMIYSRYHGEEIDQHHAKWCEFGQDWVMEDDAIKVWNTGDKFAVPGNPDVVRSYIPSLCDKYFEKRRSTWSDYLDTWVFNGAKKYVFLDKEKTTKVVEYQKRKDTNWVEVNGENYEISLAEKVDGEWKLK